MHPRSFTAAAAAACPSGDNYNTTSSSVTVTVVPGWGWGGAVGRRGAPAVPPSRLPLTGVTLSFSTYDGQTWAPAELRCHYLIQLRAHRLSSPLSS